MPTLKQFRYLVAVADTLNFRRAADLSHVSQPTLSGQLRLLEQRLGARLVERGRTRVILTPIGRDVVARVRPVLRDIQDIVDLARRDRDPLIGRTRLGVLPTLGPYLLPHILPELRRRHPALKLYIREGLTHDLVARLGTGDLDLLLTALPLRGDDMEVAPLFQEPLHLVVPKGHHLADRRSVRRRDLAGQNILTLERGHRLHRDVQELCAQCGAHLLLEYEGTSLDTLRQMVGMGLGLAFLPALYTRLEAPADRQIVVCRFADKPLTRTVCLAWRRAAPRRAQYAQIATLLRRAVHERVPELALPRRRGGATAMTVDTPSDG